LLPVPPNLQKLCIETKRAPQLDLLHPNGGATSPRTGTMPHSVSVGRALRPHPRLRAKIHPHQGTPTDGAQREPFAGVAHVPRLRFCGIGRDANSHRFRRKIPLSPSHHLFLSLLLQGVDPPSNVDTERARRGVGVQNEPLSHPTLSNSSAHTQAQAKRCRLADSRPRAHLRPLPPKYDNFFDFEVAKSLPNY
jgi:hypothetical protein